MLIDVNAAFGGRELIQEYPLETMLAQLGRIPCALAFVSCRQGMTDPTAANDQVLALCQGRTDLAPVGTIDPRETLSWRAQVERCQVAGVRLFRLYPDQAAWPVDSILFREVVDRLAGTGAALLIDATSPGLASRVAELTAGAALPVVFAEARYYPLAELLPLLERYPHVYVETSCLTSPEAVELCVARAGAGRMLFGSGTVRYPAWVAWQVLERADISAEDRERIAWRNAAELLAVDSRALVRDSDDGPGTSPVPGPVVDVHLHDKLPGTPIKAYPAASYAAELERAGVVLGVASSATAFLYDLAQGNAELATLLDQVPTLRGYVVADPRFYDDSVRELARLERDPRFLGVKIHASYARTLTGSPAMRRLFGAVAAYRKPVLIHNLGADWPEALVALAGEFPDLPIIAAHAGYGDAPHPTHDAARRLASAGNVLLEFSSTYLTTGAVRRGIEAVGIDRVVFGSDFPLIGLPYMLAAYQDADLSSDEASRVLYQNAWRLFGPHIG